MGLLITRQKKEPYWLDLDFGVRMLVRPLQSPMLSAIRAKADRLARAMEEPQAAERLLAMMDTPSMTQEEIRNGLFHHFVTVLLAQTSIIEWEGLFAEGDNGEAQQPLPVSEDTIAEAMLVPLLAESFYAKYTARQRELLQEGNGSGLSSSGTSAVARTTAAAAATPPAPSAPTRPKRRRQPKGN